MRLWHQATLKAVQGLVLSVALLPRMVSGATIEKQSATMLGPALTDDPVLANLIDEALRKRPELSQARALIRAESERVPQASALPDPVLSVGIQNDGFRSIQIGKMESSWVSIGLAQSIPWPGKLMLRSDVAAFGARQAEATLKRTELSMRAEIESTYIDLLLVRDRLALLTRLETIWAQAEGAARVRFEAGDGAQSDLLRAQLERNRLRQRRWTLAAEERQTVATLNRLREHPLDDEFATQRSLLDFPDPVLPDLSRAQTDAQSRSPEIEQNRIAAEQAQRRVELAKSDYIPDFGVNAAVMPRGGAFEPMWQVGLSVTLPVWSWTKQTRAVAENEARAQAAQSSSETVGHLLMQRVHERINTLAALLEANHLYRSGLLVQSEATVKSTMAQYQVGKVGFASVSEALAGLVADTSGYLESVATAQRIDIAQRAVSLDASNGASPEGASSSSTSSPGASTTSPNSTTGSDAAASPAGDGGATMPRM